MHFFLRRLLPGLLCLAQGRAADFYISSSGDDLAAGTSTNTAWRTMQLAVHRIRGGDTLWMAGGTYRGFVDCTNTTGRADAPITIRPLPGQTVLMKASDEVTGWQAVSNGVWRIPGWNHNSQQVFVDGELMQQLGWPSEYTRLNSCSCAASLYVPFGFSCSQLNSETGGLDIGWPIPTMPENSFYYHASAGDLYLRLPPGVDPNSRLVEVSKHYGIFYDNSKVGHFILEDLHFLHTSSLTYTTIGWAAVLLGPNDILRRGSIEWSDAVGLAMRSNALVEDCWIGRNGINGISHGHSTNVVIRGCTLQYNNYRGYTLNNAGAIKIIPSAGATVENCEVSYNRCSGIWFDSCDSGSPIVVRNNWVHHNTPPPGSPMIAQAIFIEISRNARVYNNVVANNAYIGVDIAASRDCEVYNNVISATTALYAMRIHQQSPEFPLDGVKVFNNLFLNNRCDADIVVNKTNGHLSRRITLDYNLVHRSIPGGTLSPTASSVYVVVGPSIYNSAASFRAGTGYETHGLSQPPQVDDTFRPLASSPLIDAGSPLFHAPSDASGFARVVDGNGEGGSLPDIGAYEYFAPTSSVHYVNAANPTPSAPFTTPATAATNLAQAVAAAQPGDVIEIAPGTYLQSTEVLLDKPIVVRAQGVAPVLLASGPAPHRLLTLAHAGALVEGLILKGGSAERGGGVLLTAGTLVRCQLEGNQAAFFGGGVYADAGTLLRECTFASNAASDGGGGAWLEPGARAETCVFSANIATNRGGAVYLRSLSTVLDSSLWNNRADEGAGAYSDGGILQKCRITNNQSTRRGGGVYLTSAGRAESCRFAGNQAGESGGGALLESASSLLLNSLLTANRAAEGAGAWVGAGSIQFSTLADNVASIAGGGLYLQSAARGHSVISYYNQAPLQPDLAAQPGAVLDYSCASSTLPGTGGTTLAPRFRDRVNGNFLPAWQSPCVDTGHPTDAPSLDLNEYGRVRNGDMDTLARADMGALEAGLVHYVDRAAPTPTNPYDNWTTAARNLQEAIDISFPGDVVLVAAGTYPLTAAVSIGRGVEVRSVGGALTTLLDGQNTVRCASLSHPSAVLDGFTLRRGRADSGAGIYLRSNGTLRNCILTDNESTGSLGGLFAYLTGNFPYPCSAGRDSTLHEGGGAAALVRGGTLENCLIYNNRAAYGAGVIASQGGTLRHCTVAGNTATISGGGVVTDQGGSLYGCILYGNSGGISSNHWVRGVASTIESTCTAPLPVGTGNLDLNPQLGAAAQLYRPAAASPAIDRAAAGGSLTRDLGGTPRPADGDGNGTALPDLGCWEFLPTPGAADTDRDGLSDADETTRGTLPNNPDTDGDGVPDGEEVQQATSPLDPVSWLKLRQPGLPGPTGITLNWRSVSNRVYTIHRSSNLLTGFPTPLISGLPATPPLNTRTDTTATGAGPYFYRVTSDPTP